MDDLATANGGQSYTPAAEYPGFSLPEPHTLPSGATFLLRRPNLLKMMRRGQIPNPLMEIVNRVFLERDERDLAAEAEAKGMTVEELEEEKRLEAEHQAETEPPKPPVDEQQIREELGAQGVFSFMDVVVWASIVSPEVEMEPPVGNTPLTASGKLSFDALSDADIQYIIAFANSEVAPVARFPQDDERSPGGERSGEVRDEAEPLVGHPA